MCARMPSTRPATSRGHDRFHSSSCRPASGRYPMSSRSSPTAAVRTASSRTTLSVSCDAAAAAPAGSKTATPNGNEPACQSRSDDLVCVSSLRTLCARSSRKRFQENAMTQQASVFDRLAGIGWNESVPPNGFVNRRAVSEDPYNDNPLGLATPVGEVEIETTPEHRNLIAGDPRCAGWTRSYDDPGVTALRERMRERNGIPGLEVVSPEEVERAAALFHRDGFVAVRDAIPPDQLERLRAAAAEVIETLFAADPEGAVGGGAGGLPHRYSFGGTSASRHMFHRQEWCELLDMPTTTPILTAIFGSPNYIVYGCGGDLALPGAIEYQGLHSDNVWSDLHDPIGGVTMRDLPVPSVHINFPVVDLTPENGP